MPKFPLCALTFVFRAATPFLFAQQNCLFARTTNFSLPLDKVLSASNQLSFCARPTSFFRATTLFQRATKLSLCAANFHLPRQQLLSSRRGTLLFRATKISFSAPRFSPFARQNSPFRAARLSLRAGQLLVFCAARSCLQRRSLLSCLLRRSLLFSYLLATQRSTSRLRETFSRSLPTSEFFLSLLPTSSLFSTPYLLSVLLGGVGFRLTATSSLPR